jgi:hypothetical protein
LAENVFVFRTDVKGYYASIDHGILLRLLSEQVRDPFVLRLVDDFLHHTVYCHGVSRSVGRGISLGCPLSPLLGALYLKPLDDAMARTGLFYCRFMDDWVILSPTQARFRRAVAKVNRVLQDLKVEKHPDKTFIGRISKGFDFLGYHFEKDAQGVRLRPGEATVRRYMERVAEMYADGASAEEVAAYERRWFGWVRGGLGGYFGGGVRGLWLRFYGFCGSPSGEGLGWLLS